jgi:hypothetical protein
MKRVILSCLLTPLACGIVSTALFVMQGGFGGGHGDYDLGIYTLGLPSILLLDRVPLPTVLERYDIVAVIWLPVMLNAALFGLAGFIAWHGLAGNRRDKAGEDQTRGQAG